MITLVIADDHDVVRQGIRAILDQAPDLQVIAEARDGLEAIQAVHRLEPDVLLVDIAMPRFNGLEVIRDVARISPRTKSIVLSIHTAANYIVQALRDGAHGYVLKDAQASEIIDAIRVVASGQRYLSAGISANAIEDYVQRIEPQAVDLYDTLTKREREIMQLAAAGFTSQEIAEQLSISTRTVETHRANLMRKLGLKSTAELVLFSVRRGLVIPQ